MSGSCILLGGYERVPAREWLDDIAHLPDYAVLRGADGVLEWTAGEIRALAAKGQAIDVPRVRQTAGTIWEIGT